MEKNTFEIRFSAALIIIALTALLTAAIFPSAYTVVQKPFAAEVCACYRPNDYGFSPKMQLVSSFSTDYSSSKEDRRHNVALASESFSWIAVKKGSTLSFNTLVGKRTEERGYKISKVIVDGEYTEGIGGGVCQVSTTLYNAWIRAGLGVEYVRAHSLPASYCQLSQDATVSEYIDLVLVNDSDYDVLVNGYVKNLKICFDIYAHPLNYAVKIRTELLQTVEPPAPEIIEVDEFPDDFAGQILSDAEGEYGIKREAREGYKSQAFAEYYDKDGKLIKSVRIRKDSYLPSQGKIYRKKTKSLLPDLKLKEDIFARD